jgi:hypothetical protein
MTSSHCAEKAEFMIWSAVVAASYERGACGPSQERKERDKAVLGLPLVVCTFVPECPFQMGTGFVSSWCFTLSPLLL